VLVVLDRPEATLSQLPVSGSILLFAILAIGWVLIISGGYFIVTTFTLSYVTGQLGVARDVPLIGFLFAGAGQIAGILIFA
jgi:hypothetical protein